MIKYYGIKIRRKLHTHKLLARFAVKTLFKPIGTTFEINRTPTNRFYYTYHVVKSLLRFL